ncbi:Nucleotidyl transferase of uncharacterised function (DUF1814) [Mycoplasmopsis citelli]|uniref:Nucleotidyl transferase of uncharacterized function (DUF1814) n=1 Tax=Mycoplasmopsis citelli TaxID=171281 RepID=A0A449B1X2_9BACT|nr:nucleotidyl transferase AbiEii/AbiGii toxin family protein [Mycoplasmopsis citelli]VEU74573.1 Nucleotidyl transferase of uncharacterised function (DUF1814) [Mycoplasmopsis citelli]
MKKDLAHILKDKKFKFYIDEDNPLILCFDYPKEYPNDDSLLNVIKLEFSTLSEPIPFFNRSIKPYISEVYQDAFPEKINVKVVDSLRTFYDKITILHREANRINGNYPKKYSRHYYDIYKMLESNLREKSLKNLDLLESVIEFKKKFYHCNFANYDQIYRSKLKLIPSQKAIEVFVNDYKSMKNMIFGDIVSFEQIIKTLKTYENDLNKAIKSFYKWTYKIIGLK